LVPHEFGVPGKDRSAGVAVNPEQGTAPHRRWSEQLDASHLLEPLRPTAEIVAKPKNIDPGGSNLNLFFDTRHN
jgi:hypothetical protein